MPVLQHALRAGATYDIILKNIKLEGKNRCDVKDFMMRVEFIGKIEFDKDDFGRLKKRVEIGLNNLDKQMSNRGKLDKVIFCQDMEEIASMLSRLENQLKSK